MMLIGRAAITSSSDTILEKLVQGCNPLIDLMLNSYRSSLSVGPVLGVVDKALAAPDSLLQGCLDSFVYGATATCGALIVEGCVLEATTGWHELGSDDRQLLTLLAKTGQGSFETTVYLARSSRSAGSRWVCVDLMDGVTACLLCGAVPSLNDIQTSLVERTWVNAQETLTAAKANFPHNVPAALGSLPNGLVGMLIVNTRAQWATFSDVARAPNSADNQAGVERGPARNPDETKMALCTWYKSNVTSAMAEDLGRVVEPDTHLVGCSLREGYCCGAINKCYIARMKTARGNYHVATLFDASIPTFSLRGMTTQAFEGAEPFL